jgi:hypothetical protein
VAGAAAAFGKQCGSELCHLFQYCNQYHEGCEDCWKICDPGPNFTNQTCTSECQGKTSKNSPIPPPPISSKFISNLESSQYFIIAHLTINSTVIKQSELRAYAKTINVYTKYFAFFKVFIFKP